MAIELDGKGKIKRLFIAKTNIFLDEKTGQVFFIHYCPHCDGITDDRDNCPTCELYRTKRVEMGSFPESSTLCFSNHHEEILLDYEIGPGGYKSTCIDMGKECFCSSCYDKALSVARYIAKTKEGKRRLGVEFIKNTMEWLVSASIAGAMREFIIGEVTGTKAITPDGMNGLQFRAKEPIGNYKGLVQIAIERAT